MKTLKISNDINEVCRICLDRNNALVDIYPVSTLFGSPIVDVLLRCAPVQIKKNDGLSSFICQSCLAQLLKFHQFQLQALQSEKILRRHQKYNKKKISFGSLTSNVMKNKSVKNFVNLDETDIKLETNHGENSNKFQTELLIIKNDQDIESTNNVKEESETKSVENFAHDDVVQDIKNEFEDKTNVDNKKKLSTLVKSKMSTRKNGSFKINTRNFRSKKRVKQKGKIYAESEQTEQEKTTDLKRKRYQCLICKKCFSCKSHLVGHERQHTGEKPFQCDYCGQCFSQKYTLNVHKRKHTGERPYQCKVCNKCFSQAGGLNAHMRQHTGEKPYQCDVCSRCFSRKGNLHTHKRQHTQEKPYKCDVCSKCFSEKGNLTAHRRLHTGEKPYQCDVCAKCFTVSSHLNAHKRIHTGEKPYKCEVCNKCFTGRSGFESHKRHHSGERPYQCDICNKCFVHKSNMDTHKRLHNTRDDKTY